MSKLVKILLPLVGDGVSFAPNSIVELEDDVADELIDAKQAILQESISPAGELEIDSCGVFNVTNKKTVNVQPVVALVRMHGEPDHSGLYVTYYIKGSKDPVHCLTTDEYLDYFNLPENKTLLGWTRNQAATEAEDLDDFRPVEHVDLYAVFGGAEPEPEQEAENLDDSGDNGP